MSDVAQITEKLEAFTERMEKTVELNAQKAEDLSKRWEEAQKVGETTLTEVKSQVDMLIKSGGETATTLAELQKELARASMNADQGSQGVTSIKGILEKSEGLSAIQNKSSQTCQIDMKAAVDITTGNIGITSVQRETGLLMLPKQQLFLRNILPVFPLASTSLEYFAEVAFNNNADEVAEGTDKPQSDFELEPRTANASVIAHYITVSRQALDDFNLLSSYIEQGLRYGLALKEETKLLYGDGTNNTIHGLVPQATAYDTSLEAGKTDLTLIDKIRLAMLQVTMALYPPSGVILNPVSWADIELLKKTDKGYLLSNPHSGSQKTLWNLPVVDTMSLQNDTFLVGAFHMAAAILDRMSPTITVATQHDKNFTQNKITILCENRVGLMVTRGAAIVRGATA